MGVNEFTEVTMAQRRLEAAQKELEGAHGELADLLQHEVEEAVKLVKAEQARWFNASKIEEAESALVVKQVLLKRVLKALKTSNAVRRPTVGHTVRIKTNAWTR